jgi:serine/threonine protein phosphatase PrpC
MRVTANTSQGHRKYMEDCYKIRFQRENQNDNESDILFSYFAIFDGHGGKEAAHFAKEHLYWRIIESDDFWSEDDNKVLKAIHDGFIKCHIEMWKDLGMSNNVAAIGHLKACNQFLYFSKITGQKHQLACRARPAVRQLFCS